MTDLYLATLALAALVCLVGVPLAAWLERRADAADKLAYEAMFGTGAPRLVVDAELDNLFVLDPWSRKV